MRWIIVITLMLIYLSDSNGYTEDSPFGLMEAIKIAMENNRDLHHRAQYDLKIAESNYQAALAYYKLQSNLETNISHTENRTIDSLKTSKKSKNTKYDSKLGWSWKLPALLGSEFKPFAQIDLTKIDSESIQDSTAFDKKYASTPNIGFEWKQPLCPSGVRAGHAALIQARANYQIARLAYQQVKEDLIFNVITSYYGLVSQKNQVKLAREELKLTQDLLALSQAKLEADQIAKLDLMQVQVQASSDEAKLITAENSFRNSMIACCKLLNLRPELNILNTEEVLTEPVIFSFLSFLSKEMAFKESLKNRIDVEQQQVNIDLSMLNLDIRKSENKPVLILTGNYQWNNEKKRLEDMEKDLNRNWQVSIGLDFPLLNGGLVKANIESANLNLKKMIYDYEELLKSIQDEIDQLWENIQSEKKRIEILNLNLKLAEESLKITKLKYEEGIETAIEVLRSQVSLFQMKNSINEAMIVLFINKGKLLKAIGRLEIEYKKKTD
ncbi:TolC family protein [bacterium]|nr:TolC family protein [bacterium]MBU1752614.1 TolC family protein [bacterium]